MRERPKCPLCKERGALVLCVVEGFEKSVFTCGFCCQNDPRVKGRVRAL